MRGILRTEAILDSQPDIYQYVDFRKYLVDTFQYRKTSQKSFTHRYLCNKLGLKTSNFMLLVMQGKRNLPLSLCSRLGKVFDFTPQQTRVQSSKVLSWKKDNWNSFEIGITRSSGNSLCSLDDLGQPNRYPLH